MLVQVQMYPLLAFVITGVGRKITRPLSRSQEKELLCPLQGKWGESQGTNRKVRAREKCLASNSIHTPGSLTCKVVWENERLILKLWMEIIGLH